MAALTEQEGPVTVLLLGRPERRNAVDRATAAALLAAYRRFEEDPEARVLVVAGGEESFCAGADLKALDNDISSASASSPLKRWEFRVPRRARAPKFLRHGPL